jgi:hypothetical protein
VPKQLFTSCCLRYHRVKRQSSASKRGSNFSNSIAEYSSSPRLSTYCRAKLSMLARASTMDPVANQPNLFQSDTNLSQSTTVRTRTAPQEAQQTLDKKIQASYTISDDRSNTTRQATDLLLALQHQSKRGVGEPDVSYAVQALFPKTSSLLI